MSTKLPYIDDLHPFLRWAGGKKWLVKRLGETLDMKIYSSYHEPFVGGGAMLFYFQPKNAYISDSNEQLMLTYRIVRDHIQDVIGTISSFGKGEEAYYGVRSLKTDDTIVQAARFIYLNQMSYNGIYRVNSKGDYNVPWGKRLKYEFDFKNLYNVSMYLQKVSIQTMDFEESLNSVQKNSLVFLDPPYTHSKIDNGFIQYNKKTFKFEDQERLSKMIDIIKERGAYYILTNADHSVIRDVFDKKDRVISLTRNTTIGGKNATRGQYEECIFTNTNLNL